MKERTIKRAVRVGRRDTPNLVVAYGDGLVFLRGAEEIVPFPANLQDSAGVLLRQGTPVREVIRLMHLIFGSPPERARGPRAGSLQRKIDVLRWQVRDLGHTSNA